MSRADLNTDELYFALIDAPLTRGRARVEELSYALEACLPVEMASVHAVYRDLPDGRVLVVAIDRDRAAALARTHTTAAPASWPPWLDKAAAEIHPSSINLLVGPCTPPRVRRLRASVCTHALIGLILLAAAASVGLERRVRLTDTRAAELRVAVARAYRHALGDAAARSSQPPAAMLTAELRTLRATRRPDNHDDAGMTTADRMLANLLAAWPENAPSKTESITVAERTIEIVMRVPDLETAQTFVTALGRTEGVLPGPTTTDQSGGGTNVTLRFDREVEP